MPRFRYFTLSIDSACGEIRRANRRWNNGYSNMDQLGILEEQVILFLNLGVKNPCPHQKLVSPDLILPRIGGTSYEGNFKELVPRTYR